MPVKIIDEQLFPFAVKTYAGTAFLGSGFIAAPGFALTCAHVVKRLPDGSPVRLVSTMPQLQGAKAFVRARTSPQHGSDDTWAWPDLAILELRDAAGRRLTDHPCPRIELDAPQPLDGDPLRAIIAASPRPSDPRSAPEIRGLGFALDSVSQSRYWWLKEGHAYNGMSGGMLVSPELRAIVAMLNNTRGKSADIGALATPLSALLDPDEYEGAFAAAVTDLLAALRKSARRARPEWDGAFFRRETFEWEDYWEPDVDIEHFVGRREELEKLDAALVESDGLAVVQSIGGFGGVGKTALAVAFSERSRNRFPDGRVFHDFGSYRVRHSHTAAEALGSILTKIGAVKEDEVSKLTHKERVSRWQKAVSGRRLLMVWDNVEHREQLDGLIVHAEGCATIVTSRDEVLGRGGHHLPLGVLAEADAVAMFRGIAGDDHPAELVEQLVERDLYVPVLIHVHAHEVANSVSSLRQIIKGLPAPSEARRQSDAQRQRSLFNLLGGSYRRLSEQERLAFRVLGAHPGYRATTGSLGAAMGCDGDEVRRRMGALKRSGLATSDYTDDNEDAELCSYRAHDLIRAYGAHLAEREPAAPPDGTESTELARVHDTLTDYYFESLGGQTARNRRDWFSVEVESVRDLARAGDAERFGHLARFLGYRGIVFSRYDAAEAGFLHAKAIDERRGDVARTAHCMWGLGEIARMRHDLDLAWQRYSEALALSKRADDPAGIGNAERGLGEVAQLRRDADTAQRHYDAAKAAYQEANTPRRIIYVHRGLARVAELRCEYGTARELFETALAGSQEERDAVGEVAALLGLADVALAVRDLQQADEYYGAAEDEAERAGDPVTAARAVHGRGRTALARGNRAVALKRFEAARKVFEEYDATIWLRQVEEDLAGLDSAARES